jgi:hypothetical protein
MGRNPEALQRLSPKRLSPKRLSPKRLSPNSEAPIIAGRRPAVGSVLGPGLIRMVPGAGLEPARH